MSVRVKCDCCGKMVDVKHTELLVLEEVEFDGAACNSCEVILLERTKKIKEGLNDE